MAKFAIACPICRSIFFRTVRRLIYLKPEGTLRNVAAPSLPMYFSVLRQKSVLTFGDKVRKREVCEVFFEKWNQ